MRVALLCAALEFGSRRCAVDLAEEAKAPVARTADETPAPVAESAEGEYSTGDHATDAGRGPWTKRSNSTRLKGSRKDPVDRQEFHHMHAAMPAPAPLPQAAELELGETEVVEFFPGFAASAEPNSAGVTVADANARGNATLAAAEALLEKGELGKDLGLTVTDFKDLVEQFSRDPTADGVLAFVTTGLLKRIDPTANGWWSTKVSEDGVDKQSKLQTLKVDATEIWNEDEESFKEILDNFLWQKAGNKALLVHAGSDHISTEDKKDIGNIGNMVSFLNRSKKRQVAIRPTLRPDLKVKIAPALNQDLVTETISHIQVCKALTKGYIKDMLQYVYLKDILNRYTTAFNGFRDGSGVELEFADKVSETWTSAKKKITEVLAAYNEVSEKYKMRDTLAPIKHLQTALLGDGTSGSVKGKYMEFMMDYDKELTDLFTAVVKLPNLMTETRTSLTKKQGLSDQQLLGFLDRARGDLRDNEAKESELDTLIAQNVGMIKEKGGQITTLKAAISGLETTVQRHKNELATVKSDQQQLKAKVDEKETALNDLRDSHRKELQTMDMHTAKVDDLLGAVNAFKVEHELLKKSAGHR